MKAKIRAADASCWSRRNTTTVPGMLKNAIDWASRPYGDSAWKGKPVAIMGASVGALGTARAQYDLRKCFVFLDMRRGENPEVMISAAADKFDQAGNLTDAKAKELIGKLLTALCELADRAGGIPLGSAKAGARRANLTGFASGANAWDVAPPAATPLKLPPEGTMASTLACEVVERARQLLRVQRSAALSQSLTTF